MKTIKSGISKNSKRTNKLMFVVVGARDFSPDWKHRYFGTEVPCSDNAKFQFVEQIGASSKMLLMFL